MSIIRKIIRRKARRQAPQSEALRTLSELMQHSMRELPRR